MTSPTRRTVTVCAACLKASCWMAVFECLASRDAGTVEKTAEELAALNLEHSDYWDGTYEARVMRVMS